MIGKLLELGVPISEFIDKPPREVRREHNLPRMKQLVPEYYHWANPVGSFGVYFNP